MIIIEEGVINKIIRMYPFLKTLLIQIRWLLTKPSDQGPQCSTLLVCLI